MWYHDTVHRLFQDDLASVSISRLRASGVVTGDTKSVVLFSVTATMVSGARSRLSTAAFPTAGNGRFSCAPLAAIPRVLKLHEKPMCRRCCLRHGVGYRISSGSPVERDVARVARLQKLRELLDGGPVRLHPRPGRRLDRRWSLTVSLPEGDDPRASGSAATAP